MAVEPTKDLDHLVSFSVLVLVSFSLFGVSLTLCVCLSLGQPWDTGSSAFDGITATSWALQQAAPLLGPHRPLGLAWPPF